MSESKKAVEHSPTADRSALGLPLREVLVSELLQAAWEPTKARLVRFDRDEDLRVRIHRACRALGQAELFDGDAEDPRGLDTGLIFRWIALNALYGQWDRANGMPVPDRLALDRFTSRVTELDGEGRVAAALGVIRDDARSLLESPFLIERFWAADEWENVRPQRGRMSKFSAELREGRPAAALQRVLAAVYFLRCQLVHGGSTIGSSLNRPTVEPASRILRLLTGQLLAVVIEQGTDAEWGDLCYPPVRS